MSEPTQARADLGLYEKRVEALIALSACAEDRRLRTALADAQHELEHEQVASSEWHDRWIETLGRRLVEAGVLNAPDIEERLERKRQTPR